MKSDEPSDDLVARLRAEVYESDEHGIWAKPRNPDGRQAADELSRLRTQCEAMAGALEPFARYADGVGCFTGPNSPFYIAFSSHIVGDREIVEADFAAAGQALSTYRKAPTDVG